MNSNFHNARTNKDDEFYTQLLDIKKELCHYDFKYKIIYCNCDSKKSNFYAYFKANFINLELKKAIFTYFSDKPLKIELEIINGKLCETIVEINSGDFRDNIDILKECDIVVTNPPFSLFREFLLLLIKYNKKFLIIGNASAIIYKDIFPLFKDKKVNFGFNKRGMKFLNNGKLVSVNSIWYTNIKSFKKNFLLSNKSNIYKKLLNFDCINIDNIKDIPIDYYGIMAVPITFLEYVDLDLFEIVGTTRHNKELILDLEFKNLKRINKEGRSKDIKNLGQSPYIILTEKPINKAYFIADNIEGYIVELYQRLLIKRI